MKNMYRNSIAQRIESSGMEIEVAGTAGNGMEGAFTV